jgi:hypothetical protein
LKIWTEVEMAVVRDRYPGEATRALAQELGVTTEQLRYKACSMGVTKASGARGRNGLARQWSEAEDALIRRWWPDVASRAEPGKTADWLARQLGASTEQVRHRVAVLGLRRPRTKEPAWTDDELELLDQCLHLPPPNIRARLKRRGFQRTESAIVMQRYRRLGGLAQATGGYSACQLASLLGVSTAPVVGWIKKGWLKATPRGETVAANGGPGDRWNITPRAIRQFLFENAALVNPRGINFVWLMDLLRGEK